MIKQTFTVILTLLACSAQAEIHKWVDAEGNVHFGDRPPAQQQTEQIHIKPQQTADPHTLERLQRQQDYLEQSRNQRETQQAIDAEQQAKAKKIQERCQQAKNNLNMYQRHGRMVTITDDGERHYLDDNEKQQLIERFRGEVNQYCEE